MRGRFALLCIVAAALAVGWPAASSATAPNNESNTYDFFIEADNASQDAAGDTLAVSGDGTFGVHAKSASGAGDYTFTGADGTTFSGTWTVNEVNGLVTYQPYGCGVLFGTPIASDLCGGRLVLNVTATTPFGSQPAQLTVICLIGNPPPSAEEGINAVIPSVGSFNRQIVGDNFYVKS